jgi:hypothetical protein
MNTPETLYLLGIPYQASWQETRNRTYLMPLEDQDGTLPSIKGSEGLWDCQGCCASDPEQALFKWHLRESAQQAKENARLVQEVEQALREIDQFDRAIDAARQFIRQKTAG